MELMDTSVVHIPPLLNPASIALLRADVEAAFADPSTRVLLLQGTEGTFCRGLDLGEAAEGKQARESVEIFSDLLHAIRAGRKPVIALVSGTAVAGGVGLAAACDAVLATPEATFALTELLFGLLPAIIFPHLAQRIGAQRARWMAMTARTTSSEEALAWGLVDAVCGREKTTKVVQGWIRQFRRINPAALAIWKQLTAEPTAHSRAEAVEATLERLTDPAVREGLLEFLASGSLPFLPGNS